MNELKLFKKNELSQIDVQAPTAMQVKIEEELERSRNYRRKYKKGT